MKHKLRLSGLCLALWGLVACNAGVGNSQTIGSQASSSKVQNGLAVTAPSLNGMIPLIYREFSGQRLSICSGTLLDSNTILTAAHCVIDMPAKKYGEVYSANQIANPSTMGVLLSKNLEVPVDINSKNPNWNKYSIAKIYVHPAAFKGAEIYANGSFGVKDIDAINDVAIIKLEQNVGNQYRFAKLAKNNPKLEQNEIIAGYGTNSGAGVTSPSEGGQSGLLRSAISQVVDILGNGSYINVGGIINEQIGYTKICQGDSGGPDLINDDNSGSFTITGVHSFGNGANCGTPNEPSSSLSVAYYNDWIKEGYLNNHL